MVTTGDVGLPASALRSRYPQVTFFTISNLFAVHIAYVIVMCHECALYGCMSE